MRARTLLSSLVLLAALALFTSLVRAQEPTKADSDSTARSARTSTATDAGADGEKRFTQQCGRCHTPPVSISPRIAKTVVRHMRIRASLSKEDEELILKYISPGSAR